MHFLLWTKRSHQSSNFGIFKCSGENLRNSSCHFPNHKTVFFQILNNCSVLWKITPLYFFRSNVIYQGIRKIFVLYKPCSIEWNISHAKILKVGDKHARVIWDTCSKLSIGREKHRHIFSLWTTFNNPLGVLIDNFKRIYRFGSFIVFFYCNT